MLKVQQSPNLNRTFNVRFLLFFIKSNLKELEL